MRPRDKFGREIYAGDVLKVFHFIDAINKRHFMYKIVHEIAGNLYAAHAHTVYKFGLRLSNSYALPRDGRVLRDYEIVDGYEGGYFEDRDKEPVTRSKRDEINVWLQASQIK